MPVFRRSDIQADKQNLTALVLKIFHYHIKIDLIKAITYILFCLNKKKKNTLNYSVEMQVFLLKLHSDFWYS